MLHETDSIEPCCVNDLDLCSALTLSTVLGTVLDTVSGKALPTVMGPQKDDDDGIGDERGVATKTRAKTKKPSMYRVLLMNDDYTPMEFVVSVLMKIFNKSADEATAIMLAVHKNGVGVCGIFTFEIAETKVSQVMNAAQRAQHPLQCTMEKA